MKDGTRRRSPEGYFYLIGVRPVRALTARGRVPTIGRCLADRVSCFPVATKTTLDRYSRAGSLFPGALARAAAESASAPTFGMQGRMAFVLPIEPSRDRPAMNAREKIEQDGYVVFRQVLTATELGRLRDTLTRHFEQHYEIEGLGLHQPNAAFAIPELDWLIAHPAILDSFREVLGGDRLVFTGNCDAHMNMLSWWHKDTSESRGSCFRGDYGSPDCRVYRAGIYLQDHLTGQGLSVRRGSHYTRSLTEGPVETVATRAGDLILFDIRLTHAGQMADPIETLLLRLGRRLRREREVAAIKARYQAFLGKPKKLSVFFTYGVPGSYTDEYLHFEYLAKQASPYGGAPLPLVERLTAMGVEFPLGNNDPA